MQPPPLQLRRPGSGEINKNGDESVVLIHPVGDLTLAFGDSAWFHRTNGGN